MPTVDLVICDMDDTLVASHETWQRAERRLFALLGHPYSSEIAEQYKGMNARDVGKTIHAALHPLKYTAEECGQLLRGFLTDAFSGPLTPMPGADTLIRRLAGHVRLAVASGSPVEVIETVLTRCGWRDAFSVIVSSENVPRGKPAPDVFLAVAVRCDVAPAACLVLEDSLNGVRAAKRAGMICYAVPSSADPRIVAEADRAFPRLDAITRADLAWSRE